MFFSCLVVGFCGSRGSCFLKMDSWIFSRELLNQLHQTLCSSVTRHRYYFLEVVIMIWMFWFHFCHIIGLIFEVFLRSSCSKLPRWFWIVYAELSKTVWGRANTLFLLYCSFKYSKCFDWSPLENLKCGINRADLENLCDFTYLPEKKSKRIKRKECVCWKISPIHSLSSSLQVC